MKFDLVIEYNKNIFLQKIMEKMRQGLVPGLLFFKKALYEVKASNMELYRT